MSPRAACRLEALGFVDVYDYVPGKTDWTARGLPTEGENAARPRAHQFAEADVVAVGLDEPLARVAERIAGSAYPFALVVGEQGTVLGRIPRSAIESSAGGFAEDAMEPGPRTIRADVAASELLQRLTAQKLDFAVVTTPEGRLVGVVRRSGLPGADS